MCRSWQFIGMALLASRSCSISINGLPAVRFIGQQARTPQNTHVCDSPLPLATQQQAAYLDHQAKFQ